MQTARFLAASSAFTALAASAPPRSIARPRAAAKDPAAMLAEIATAFTDFRDSYDGKIESLDRALNAMAVRESGRQLTGMSASTDFRPPDPAYTELFASFVRGAGDERAMQTANASGDRYAIKAAMSEGVDSGGGFVTPIEWDRKITQKQRIFSPMRRIATTIQTNVRGFSTVWSDGQWGSGWVGETAARPSTSTPTLSSVMFPAGQLYAMPVITQDLLDDAEFNASEWLQNEVGEVFSVNEGVAFVAGDGVNKPRGFLTYAAGQASDGYHPGGNLAVVPVGDAANILADGLVKFVYALKAPYRVGATWLMNSVTASKVALLKNGQDDYIWRQGIAMGLPSTLLGYPVEIDENMPDVAANATPIAFGDFKRGYVVNDRQGVTVLRDPYTNKPFVSFYTRKRVGGGVWDPNAIELLKISVA